MEGKSWSVKIILIAAITLVFISGCSFLNKGEQGRNTKNKSNQEKDVSEERPDLKGYVLSISGDEITIGKAKISETKGGYSTGSMPRSGAKVDLKDMGKFKFNTNTKIVIRNSYDNGGKSYGSHKDKTGVKDNIKAGAFVEVWTEKAEEADAKTVRISIFNK